MKRIIILALAVSVTWTASTITVAVETVTLLTSEEGAVADVPSTGLVERGAEFSTGPEIQVLQPDVGGNPLRPPITILVKFMPRPDRPVDLSTLKVECLKIITIDITKRVLPYATKDGINVAAASFPPGEHRLRITLGDISGGVTRKVFFVKVL
jgi:hypothetical protein